MTWQFFLIGLALVFIIEGIMPFLSPRMWRRGIQQLMLQSDRTLHIFGLSSMLVGVLLLYWVH